MGRVDAPEQKEVEEEKEEEEEGEEGRRSRVETPCHTPHAFRGPIGSSTEGPSGCVRMRFHPHFGTPLTCFVAP